MYVVISDSYPGKILMHDGENYIWKDPKLLENYLFANTSDHQFLFDERGEAWHVVTKHHINAWLRIVQLTTIREDLRR